jgi:predicted Fe-Mo cluster-binding NifX family protein
MIYYTKKRINMKVAVPVEGENLKIVTRTGRAPFFAIFEFNGDEFKLIELNENTHANEHEHEHEGQEEYTADEVEHHHKHVKASKVDDCNYIVIRAVGPNMKDALAKSGVKIIKVKKNDGEYALEALEKVKDELK